MNTEGFPKVFGPVLIIDDHKEFRTTLKEFLEEKGMRTIVLNSALHATKFIQNQPWNWYPSLIFTDIVMDGMGGYQFIRGLEELYPRKYIPVVVISKLNTTIDIGEAEAAGAAGYITKPLDFDRIEQVLKLILKKTKKGVPIFVSPLSQ